jgi:hypothetical protein
LPQSRIVSISLSIIGYSVKKNLTRLTVNVEIVAVADGRLEEDADREGKFVGVLVFKALQVEVVVLLAIDVEFLVEVGVGVLADLG